MDRLAIGIDLGTSTSEIAVFQHGEPLVIPDPGTKNPVIPSLVARTKGGELLVGEAARSLVDMPGYGAREVKRIMGSRETVKLGEQTFRPEEISAVILNKLKANAEEFLGAEITDVVLSVPATFHDSARQATKNAGELASLNILQLINEPTAAAMAFGVKNIDVEAQLVVFDFGGGTLDITTLEMMEGVLDVKTSFGDPQLGGKDFDEAMINLILRKFTAKYGELPISDKQRGFLKAAAEKAKIALSTARSYMVFLPAFATKRGDVLDLEIEVTREEFERAVAPLLDRAKSCIVQALNAKQIRPSSIDRVLLVGGTTYIPCVRHLVAEIFGQEPRADINPDLAVAMGAATMAATKVGLINPQSGLLLSDVAPYGLGIDVYTDVGGQYVMMFEPLIKPNTPVPFKRTFSYSLLHANQHDVQIHLYQDYRGVKRPLEAALAASDPADAIVFTEIQGEIDKIPPSADGFPHRVEIDFSYDSNGLVRMKANIPAVNKSVEVQYLPTMARLGKDDMAAAKARVQALINSASEDEQPEMAAVPASTESDWQSHQKAKRYTPLISKAERMMDELPRHRQTLETAVQRIKDALSQADDRGIEEAGDRLTDLLFDLDSAR